MSMPFNPNQYSSSNYQSHLGLLGNSFNRQFQMHNSNYNIMHDQNHANILNSQLNSNNYHFDSNVGLGQTNRLISQLNSTTTTTTTQSRPLFVEQFGVGQRVNNYEVRNTSLLPQRVQVVQSNTSVNVDYFPIQNQYSISSPPLGDQVCVTEVVVRTQEVVRTQLLKSTSTRERFLGHNNQYGYGSLNFQNPITNHPRVYQTQPFHNSNNNYSQNPNYQYNQYSQIPNPSFNQNPSNRNVTNNNHATPRPTQNAHKQHYPNSNVGETILTPQPLNVQFPDGTSIYPIVDHNKEDHDNSDIFEKVDDDYDGRTHSAPYKKYGPYTCPRCDGVFTTSQMFAAHVGSHYKDETVEQRRRRRLAKQRKKSMRVLKLNGGLSSVVPRVFKRQSAAVGCRKNNDVAANHVEDRVVVSNRVDHDDDEEKEEISGVGKEIVAIPI